jgi:hypothetical protein
MKIAMNLTMMKIRILDEHVVALSNENVGISKEIEMYGTVI